MTVRKIKRKTFFITEKCIPHSFTTKIWSRILKKHTKKQTTLWKKKSWPARDSNPGPPASESTVLTTRPQRLFVTEGHFTYYLYQKYLNLLKPSFLSQNTLRIDYNQISVKSLLFLMQFSHFKELLSNMHIDDPVVRTNCNRTRVSMQWR